ncbi:NifU family protein [Sulfurihydrogenibium yellowstonense]|uniref:Conserved domain protein n=1 Tax=Sulfurihydrogenibium yellowstonense SS-5 TaxID=432331 RepID=C4FKS3_9AQUI|nr:NifU family protein [Sulfurihydrogenibium yellowstonense]EEP60326.1 conserved domain protein [Sulfurihydrogenibium yellowstonense SS-5]
MVAFDKEQEVREILDKVRPALLADAGNIELVKVENDEVFLKLYGTCQTCPVADMTMKDLVIYTIKESLPWVKL